jgi:hypothetical protein
VHDCGFVSFVDMVDFVVVVTFYLLVCELKDRASNLNDKRRSLSLSDENTKSQLAT